MVSAVPLTRVVEIVDVPLDPCWSERLVGFAPIEKSFGGAAGQPGSSDVPIGVLQLNALVAGMYSFADLPVHPSAVAVPVAAGRAAGRDDAVVAAAGRPV